MPLKPFIIENFIFPISDFIFRTEITESLKTHRSYTNLNQAELYELQRSKLLSLLNHCCYSCEGYHPYKKEIDDPFEWLKIFPVLTKEEVVNNGNRYISDKYKKEKLIKYESSGSSGLRSVVYVDKFEQSVFRAILMNWWGWNGYYLGKPLMQTGMTPNRGFIKGMKDFMLSTIYVNAFKSSEYILLKKLRKVENKNGYHLFGYASSLYVLAQIAEKYKLNIIFDIAMSQGDKLFDHYRKKIEDVFKCQVVEDYGLNEGIMIGQKKDLPFFYIYTPAVYLEILDEHDQPVADGTMGRIIATKLDGYAMPLIRYDTGDLGIMLPREEYPSKRDLQFPLLKTVVGRNTDIIKTKDGKSLIVHTFTGIFEFFPEILQFQVIQDSVERLIIKYIPSGSFKLAVLSKIEKMLRERTDTEMSIQWERVSYIPPSKSGKPQIIINNLLARSLSDQLK